MSIQEKTYTSKRTGKTITQFCAVVYDTKSKKHIWSKCCKTKKEARQCEKEIIETIESGTRVDKSKSFLSLSEEWLAIAPTIYSNSTYRGYLWYTNKYIIPVFGDVKVSTIEPIHVQKFVTAMSNTYSPETVNKTLNILSNIFKLGVDLKMISSNPCERIKRIRIPNKKHVTWTEEQIIYFLNLPSVKTSMYHDMFIISFTLGIRPSEICGISETDFIQNGILSINRGYDRYGCETDLKTDASHRPLELSNSLVKLLNKRLTNKKKQRLALGLSPNFKDNDFLFTNSVGHPINPNNYAREFRKLLRNHNTEVKGYQDAFGFTPSNMQMLPEIRLYDARHSFATNNILSNSASIKVISEILGHSNVKTTLHTYTQVTQSMSKTAIDDYSDKLLGRMSI